MHFRVLVDFSEIKDITSLIFHAEINNEIKKLIEKNTQERSSASMSEYFPIVRLS